MTFVMRSCAMPVRRLDFWYGAYKTAILNGHLSWRSQSDRNDIGVYDATFESGFVNHGKYRSFVISRRRHTSEDQTDIQSGEICTSCNIRN